MLAKSLLLTISLLALEVSAFWRMPCKGRLTMDRLDPIDTPGAPAHHAHAIHGGDGLYQSLAVLFSMHTDFTYRSRSILH